MKAIFYVLLLVVSVAGGKSEVIPAHLPQFRFARSGPAKHLFYSLEEAWGFLGCVDCISMLVESYMTSF
jgi:hypothetical protein